MNQPVLPRLSATVAATLLCGAASLLAAAPALAQTASTCSGGDDGNVCDISTTATQVPATGVTLSNSTQTNYTKYTFTLQHYPNAAEGFTSVTFSGDTSVGAPGASPSASIVSYSAPTVTGATASGSVCTITTATHIDCTFNFSSDAPFSGANATIAFDVTVSSPQVGTNTAGGSMTFTSVTKWTDGDESEGSQPFATVTPLTAPDPKVVATYLPAAGTVTTGTDNGAATCVGGPNGNDPNKWVTLVSVPASAQVSVNLNRGAEPQVAGTYGNYTQIDIPGVYFGVGTHWYDPGAASVLLVNTLRRDVCTIGDGTNSVQNGLDILREKIYYKPDPTPTNPNPTYTQVYLCLVTSGPFPGQPCIASAKVYEKFNLPNVPNKLDYLGDHEWVIYANENGRYQN